MKKTKLLIEMDSLSGYDFFPFLEISNLIDWSLNIRGENRKLNSSINYNIILQCCTFIEGSMCQVLLSIIEYRKTMLDQTESIYKEYTLNTLNETKKKINESQWSNYSKIYESLLGYSVSSKIDNDLWKSIQILFSYRNAITHGNILTIEYTPIKRTDECSIEALEKYGKIYEYFTEKKLIRKTPVGFVSLMNDDIADFFAKQTKEIVGELIGSVENKSEKFIVVNQFVYLDEMNNEEY